METSTILSDDDYDVISNPGQRSLENSVADLTSGERLTAEIREPPVSQAAQNKFETLRWSPTDIQAFVRKTSDASNQDDLQKNAQKVVKVYVDGAFDKFNVGHALQLRQARLSFPTTKLIVGVFSDDTLKSRGYATSWTEVERFEIVRHCRWVDEVIVDAPWNVSEDFLRLRRIDYIAVEEGTSVDPDWDELRLIGYDEMKRRGKVVITKRTIGLTVSRTSNTSPPTPVAPTSRMPSPKALEFADNNVE